MEPAWQLEWRMRVILPKAPALMSVAICAASPAWVHSAGEGAPAQQSAGSARLPGEGDQDRKFVETAYATLVPAVMLSKLGAEKASDSEVVALSEKIVITVCLY